MDAPSPSATPGRARISLGTKFLFLIAITLVATSSAILVNATRMFKRDNLDNISLSSDLLTASKAAQVRTWLDGLLGRAAGVARSARAKGKPGAAAAFENEQELLLLELFEIDSSGKRTVPRGSWSNDRALANQGFVRPGQAGKKFEGPVEAPSLARGETVSMRPWVDPRSRKTALVLTLAPVRSGLGGADRLLSRFVVSGAAPNRFLAETGPYTFALLNSSGQLLAHKNTEMLRKPDGMMLLPIVKKMLTSGIDRELTEFEQEGVTYLGAYAKLGVGGLGVVNTVSRAIALETGNALMRRSVIIGALVFFLALIFAYLFVLSITSPVEELRSAALGMSGGDFSRQVVIRTRDEIADLGESFNFMGREISRRVQTLARVNEAAARIRQLKDQPRLLEFSLDLFGSLFGFSSSFGFYQDRSRPERPEIHRARNGWTETPFSKDLLHGLSLFDGPTNLVDPEGGTRYMACPILHQGLARGCLLFAGRSTALNAEELSLARTVLSIVAAEFENIAFGLELQTINAELEQRVADRTRDLASANDELSTKSAEILLRKRELDDVMLNIQQGIMTFGASATINPEYSAYVLTIFGAESLAGADLTRLLCPSEAAHERGEDLREWIKSVFEAPADWEILKDFGIKELQYQPADGGPAKDLQFEWRPIWDGQEPPGIQKMMLVCLDVTEQKRLQAEIAKKEAEHTEQLEMISQLIKHPKSVVEQFAMDFARNLKGGLAILAEGADAFSSDSVVRLLRSLHTIKGSARQFNLGSVQRKASELESTLSPLIDRLPGDGDRAPFFESLTAEFAILEAALRNILMFYEKVMGGEAGGASIGAGGGGGMGAGLDERVVPVSLSKIETLLNTAFHGPGLIPPVAARKAVAWLLKKPVGTLYDRLAGLAASLAPELDREIVVERAGDAVQIDMRILTLMYDALLHAVRNSMDHGGEPPDEREAKGKPRALTIRLSTGILESGLLHIQVADDGKGIDVEAVKKRAIARGLVDESSVRKLSEQEIMEFIFLAGFSTKEEVSDVSGRGVGMEVLKNVVEKELHGQVRLHSVPEEGTRIDLMFSPNALIAF